MNKRSLITLLLMALIAAFTACERRPLEVWVAKRVRVKVLVRWQVNYVVVYGEQPNGMTLRIWDEEGRIVYDQSTHEQSVYVELAPGTYRSIVFNEVASEYQDYGMSFYDAADYDAMTFRSRRYTRSGKALSAGQEFIVPPEYPRIAVATRSFTIADDMVGTEKSYLVDLNEFERSGQQTVQVDTLEQEIDVEPMPMTVDLYLRLIVKHRDNLSAVEGSLSGMADGFLVTQTRRTTETGFVWLDPDASKWRRVRLTEDADKVGEVTTRVASYGLPYGKEAVDERQADDNVLSLRLTLADGQTRDYVYSVGKLIQYLTPEGEEARIRQRDDLKNLRLEIQLPDTLVLPDVPPSQRGAGFDAKVADWDDGGTIDMRGF